jgi:hypothetical protein
METFMKVASSALTNAAAATTIIGIHETFCGLFSLMIRSCLSSVFCGLSGFCYAHCTQNEKKQQESDPDQEKPAEFFSAKSRIIWYDTGKKQSI